MRFKRLSVLAAVAAAICLVSCLRAPLFAAAPATLSVHVDQPGHAISPTLFGAFFEEINHSGDGGLYAEMVNNRSAEDASTPDHWSLATTGAATGTLAVAARIPAATYNTRAIRLTITDVTGGSVGAANEGYWGMSVRQGAVYDVSLQAMGADGFQGPLTVSLQSVAGQVLAQATTPTITTSWATYTLTLTATATDPAARLVISGSRVGTVWLDVVSVFPHDTFKSRPNGLRVDLANMLAAMKPTFVRFPGGCWVEGDKMATSYRWKQTIGTIADRRTQWNLWQYYSTNGLGYHEYLQMCEDLGAEPLFVINVGMSHQEVVPLAQMGPYVQDALDAIEYANGAATSTWGAVRSAAGHPLPFNLKYMEIGNENGGTNYTDRFALFYDAIRVKYPNMKLVADVWGGYPGNRKPDLIDEHYYSSPDFFIQNAAKYDTYDRTGPKVYVGEYAVTQGCGQGNLAAALGEAAFMTGLERNSDVVAMASYAPLFANVNYKKWNPDTINFDSSRVYGTPSYYVQQMFGANVGDVVLPLELDSPAFATAPQTGGIGLSTWATQADFRNVEVKQGDKVVFTWAFAKGQGPWKVLRGQWSIQDSSFRQMDNANDSRATVANSTWGDYTLTLKARKISGSEGFLVMVRVRDDDNWIWWNIGGWGNTRHALQWCTNGSISELPGSVAGSVITGQWYDIKVDVAGDRVRCYLDGALIHDLTLPQSRALYAAASLAKSSGDTILKVVNVSGTDCDTAVNVTGIAGLTSSAAAITLAGSPSDENTLALPAKVAPVSRTIPISGTSFHNVFPAHSLTVLRLKPTR